MSTFTVVQLPTHTRPLGNPPTWIVVVGAADYRCECTGACGRTHTRTRAEGRCDREHDRAGVRLMAAPADLMLSLTDAADLTPDELRAWCPDCHRRAQRKQAQAVEHRRHDTPAAETLFEL